MAIGRIPEPLAGIQEAILDAKGDLISATAADTPARLAVGSNNQILMADSAQSTGLKWAASATSTLTAKGDLLTATAANTIARLGVGADGTTLVADSAQSTGLKWATASSSFSGVRVFNSTALTLTNGTYTQLTFNSESYDTDGYHSTTTNTGRLTPPSGKGGYFYVYCFGILQQTGNPIEAVMRLDNSSSEFARANIYYGTAGAPTLFCSSVQYISDTDYIVANVYINTNANKTFEISGTYGQFGMVRLGA